MPTAFAADVLRRPIIMVAAWLIALQAFLAGVATAQAAVKLAPSIARCRRHLPWRRGSTGPVEVPDADQILAALLRVLRDGVFRGRRMRERRK